MAKRTEVPTKPDFGDQLPPSLPPTESRPFWLGWAALILVIMIGGALIVFLSVQSKPKPVPVNSAPPASAAPTTLGPSAEPSTQGVPATTYEAFAALPSSQQQAMMQAAIDNYGAVVGQAFLTLNASSLPQIATGDELLVLQQDLQRAIQYGYPDRDQSQATILGIVLSPQPYRFVSVHIRSTGTDQYLDPKTLQPIQGPSPSSETSTLSLVIEGGVWKVSEQIRDAAP